MRQHRVALVLREPVLQPHHEDEPRQPAVRVRRRQDEFVHVGQFLQIPLGHAAAGVEELRQPPQLREAKSAIDIRQAEVVAQASVREPPRAGVAALVTEADAEVGQARVVGHDHAALPRRHLLVWVESKRGSPGEGTGQPAFVRGADDLAGILDDRDSMGVGDGHDAVHRHRPAEDVDRQEQPRPLGDGRRHTLGVHVPCRLVDVDKDGRGALEQRAVGRGDKRKRRGDHLVARPEAEGLDQEVQGAGAGVDGHAALKAHVIGERPLELAQLRAQAQVRRLEDRDHGVDIRLRDVGPSQRHTFFGHGAALSWVPRTGLSSLRDGALYRIHGMPSRTSGRERPCTSRGPDALYLIETGGG